MQCTVCWKYDICRNVTICPFQTVQDIVRFLRDGGKNADVDEAAG